MQMKNNNEDPGVESNPSFHDFAFSHYPLPINKPSTFLFSQTLSVPLFTIPDIFQHSSRPGHRVSLCRWVWEGAHRPTSQHELLLDSPQETTDYCRAFSHTPHLILSPFPLIFYHPPPSLIPSFQRSRVFFLLPFLFLKPVFITKQTSSKQGSRADQAWGGGGMNKKFKFGTILSCIKHLRSTGKDLNIVLSFNQGTIFL